MVKKKAKVVVAKKPKTTVKFTKRDAKLLPRLSLAFFDRPRLAAILWLAVTIFGILSYTTFLKREGFPSINVPYAIVSGAYLVNDPVKVDAQVTKPISDLALKDETVKSVQATARDNFFTVAVQYDEGTDAQTATSRLEKQVKEADILPEQATVQFIVPKFGFTDRGDDVVISFYANANNVSTEQLTAEAKKATDFIKQQNLDLVKEISVIDPFVSGVDPLTGQVAITQKTFDRYGERQNDSNNFFSSVAIGVTSAPGADIIKLDNQVQAAVAKYNNEVGKGTFTATVSAEYASQIKEQVGELQKALLEGLIAVLVIGSIVIAVRASFVTVISMVTVLLITAGILLLVGYSLNTITLFALILALSLIVDDTIIMVEAIDAQRKRQKTARAAVGEATHRVSRAMIAATSTAALSFAPLLFVGGILGSFIRAIPVTIITALVVSLIVALIFIPLFARFILLGKKQMGEENSHEFAAGFEARVARFIGAPMLWARGSRKKLFTVGITAVIIGLSFIGAGGYLFQKVTFNIFPPSKDSNGLVVSLNFDSGTTITQAESVAANADAIVGKNLGANFVKSAYYASGSAQAATNNISIISYSKRDVTAPQLVAQLDEQFKDFNGAQVKISQADIGPPTSPFNVRIQTDNREAGLKLANDIATYLNGRELKRPSGEVAKVTRVTVSDPGTFQRADGVSYIEVSAEFDDTDTTTLVTLAKTEVEKEFTATKLESYGLDKNVLNFDFGQETENQDSFKTLALAFPILLGVIFILLAVQFKSLIQPLLIFMAIPFSLFGITLGLYLTDNAFSFFAMLGFFALIGLSIKNTILLTDFANQARRAGMNSVDAAVEALSERFRPLIATSFTAVTALIPLAIASPFWEGLAVVLIFGLLSSTLLVITVFPYYYLGAEFMRHRVSRKGAIAWIIVTAVIMGAIGSVAPQLIMVGLLAAIIGGILLNTYLHRRKAKKA